MVRELNFDHIKVRGILGNNTYVYTKKLTEDRKRTGGNKAKYAVNKAIKNGLLKCLKTNSIPCAHCGYRARVYEHRDYNQPLEVLPVCHSCNAKEGKAMPLHQ